MPRSKNIFNEYTEEIDPELYERIPKAVLAAILIDLIIKKNDNINKTILLKWESLFNKKKVSQSPLTKLIKRYKLSN